MKFGCHLSIRNGYLGAAQTAQKIGASSFQFFPKNPRSLVVKEYDEVDAQHCANFCKENRLISISHAPYPTNVSVVDSEMRRAILNSLKNDLEITNACGGLGLVVHFGKFKGQDTLEGYKLMIEMLNDLLQDWQGESFVLIENNAGQGVRMGTTFEELVQVRNLCDYPAKIGFCLDTCHAFASGLWRGDNWREVLDHGKQLGYFDQLKAVHLNDSVYPCESFRDRHASIGKGHIGEQNIRDFLDTEILQGIPIVLETPTFIDYSHQDEIQYLKRLTERRSDN